MTEYTEQAVLVDALRRCQNDGDCFKCKFQYNDLCKSEMLGKAADMIESQYRQIEELRQEITEKDKKTAVRDENLRRALQDATQRLCFYEDFFEEILYVVKKTIRGA